MTKEEALQLLKKAPVDEMPSAINIGLTRRQAVNVVRNYLNTLQDGEELPRLFEKRVWQVVKNQIVLYQRMCSHPLGIT